VNRLGTIVALLFLNRLLAGGQRVGTEPGCQLPGRAVNLGFEGALAGDRPRLRAKAPGRLSQCIRQDLAQPAYQFGFAAAAKLPVNVLGVFAATENLPSGTSYKPGDVFKAYNGKTMEIVNTDAEGRLVLSDVLHYVNKRFKPRFMIDLATLTGAIVVALGTPAKESGLRSGDVIIKADASPVGNPGELIRVMRESNGSSIRLDIVRKRKPQTITLRW